MTHGVAREQLRSFVERIERAEETKREAADDVKDIYAEAKSFGFDTKILKKVIALRKKDEQERTEEEAILDAYKMALGMIPQLDMFDKETGEVFDTRSPRKAAEAVSERTAIEHPHHLKTTRGDESGTPEGSVEDHGQVAGCKPESQTDGIETVTVVGTESGTVANFETCERCQGNGEIVTDWERYKHPHEGDIGDEAVAECPDCGGEGIIDVSPIHDIPSDESDPTGNEAGETSTDANTGGDHVDPDHSHAATAGTRINHIVPATQPKTARDFRPHCLKPDACGASGLDHCYSCKRAMKAQEEFA